MVSMNRDAALQPLFDSRTSVGHVELLRDSARERSRHHTVHRSFDPGASWTQGIRPPIDAVPVPPHLNGDRLHDDALDAVRGIALSVVLGLGVWILIGGLIGAFFL